MPGTADRRPYHHGNLRRALLDAAEHGLREHGAEKLSLRDLARELNVSHGAPRRHFPDRQALVDALAEAGFDRLGSAMQTAIATTGDRGFPEQLRGAVTAFAHFATGNPALYELMNASKHRPEGASRVAQAATAAFAHITRLIETGQAEGQLQDGDPAEVGLILYATIHGITAMTNSQMIEPERLGELINTAVWQFLRGASPA